MLFAQVVHIPKYMLHRTLRNRTNLSWQTKQETNLAYSIWRIRKRVERACHFREMCSFRVTRLIWLTEAGSKIKSLIILTGFDISPSLLSLPTQLPQSEIDGLDPNCRRFRLENGESLAEKDEVSNLAFICLAVSSTSGSCCFLMGGSERFCDLINILQQFVKCKKCKNIFWLTC